MLANAQGTGGGGRTFAGGRGLWVRGYPKPRTANPRTLNSGTPTVLEVLTAANFRNLAAQTVACGPGVHFVSGPNGAGKTNLLDACYYLCLARSHFPYGDASAVAHGSNWLRLEGRFTAGGRAERIALKLQPRKGKTVERGGAAYDSLAEHIGLLPAVMISPADVALVVGGPEERRRFLDQTISQYDPRYLAALLAYNRVLRQRNALLKAVEHPLELDLSLLAGYDRQLLGPAQVVHEARAAFASTLEPHFAELYAAICGGAEVPALAYRSKLAERPYAELLLRSRDQDVALARTNAGPHRDELELALDGEGLRRFASQGQLKTFALALRLAQARLLRLERGKTPIVLLDDLFDRLDSARVQHLVDLLTREDYAQVFITDTHPERLRALRVEGREVHHYAVEGGVVTKREPAAAAAPAPQASAT